MGGQGTGCCDVACTGHPAGKAIGHPCWQPHHFAMHQWEYGNRCIEIRAAAVTNRVWHGCDTKHGRTMKRLVWRV